MLRAATTIALIAGLATGCYLEPEAEYPYVAGPDLVNVAPGVEVVAGYDYPLFFTGGYYWLWWGGGWYSSPYWNHGWAHARDVPPRIRGIQRPETYAHFRASPAYRMRRAPGYVARPARPTHFVAPAVHARHR